MKEDMTTSNVPTGTKLNKDLEEDQHTIQSLFYAGNIPPSQNLRQNGRVYGFSNYRTARLWQKRHKYKAIWQFLTKKYKLDPKTYGGRPDDNEYICFDVSREKQVSVENFLQQLRERVVREGKLGWQFNGLVKTSTGLVYNFKKDYGKYRQARLKLDMKKDKPILTVDNYPHVVPLDKYLVGRDVKRGTLSLLDKKFSETYKEGVLEPQQEKELKDFINKVNMFAWQPINYEKSNKRWLWEQYQRQKNHSLWKNLSRIKSCTKYFRKTPMEPEEGIFFVRTAYLRRQAGNPVGGLDKEKRIRQAISQGKKLATPQYWLPDNHLGEGNHRVFVMEEMDELSVPVRVYWK